VNKNDNKIEIIKSQSSLSILASDSEEVLPVLPLQTGVLFPEMMLTLQMGRPDNLELIKFCLDGNREFVA